LLLPNATCSLLFTATSCIRPCGSNMASNKMTSFQITSHLLRGSDQSHGDTWHFLCKKLFSYA
jgi:hypothetical protein